ncbi:MAG: hypothetical protein J7M34_10710, partial [Anaerolineae bacterium]|nr:hypothetical protein [Anaerolineae bacterium]
QAWVDRDAPAGRADLTLSGYGLAYLALHTVVGFQVWDRYVLPLVPIIALIGARILLSAADGILALWKRWGERGISHTLLTALMVFTLTAWLSGPALSAAASRFPVGSDHGAYDGIDQVAAFLKSKLPPGAVLYHRWLGWHWRYYLYDVLFNFRYYDSTEALVRDASGPPQIVRYIVFPGWHLAERDAAEVALATHGIAMIPCFETRRADGTTSFLVYRIERVDAHGR